MKSSQMKAPRPTDPVPEEVLDGAERTFKAIQLRLLMKHREEVVQTLIQLDFDIWALEEFFRTNGNP